MRYKEGEAMGQQFFEPMSLDDFLPPEHICRVIEAFTRQLDVAGLGYKYAECKKTGTPPYNPRMMLNLYIYGYLNKVRSSRRLEKETIRNVEVMWLMHCLRPDDKTIANFRKDNAKALRGTFREFSLMCRELELYGKEVVAVDGTKIRANNSRKNNFNKEKVEKELTEIDKRISEYMEILEKEDKADAEKKVKEPSAKKIEEAIKELNERKVRYEGYNERVEAEGEISTVDPDSRLMRQGGDGRKVDVCYNVQTVVEGKNKLIVDFEVTSRSDDKGNLELMSDKAKEIMGVEEITVLADKGYYDGEDIMKCESKKTKCLVAKPRPGGKKVKDGWTINDMKYDKESCSYICPCGKKLELKGKQKRKRKQKQGEGEGEGKVYLVYMNSAACRECSERAKCTKSEYRKILRLPYQDVLDGVEERRKNNKALYKRRQEIVEHPYGTVKAVWGYRQYLCRGKETVAAETSLAFLAYNFRRVMTIYADDKQFFTGELFINLTKRVSVI
jgi:transposase